MPLARVLVPRERLILLVPYDPGAPTREDPTLTTPAERPADAIPGRGGLVITLRSTLGSGLDGVLEALCRTLHLPGATVRVQDRVVAAHGTLDFNGAIARSSDVYFYELAGGYREFAGLGADRIARYARAFGLGAPTGLDLPGEAAGLVPDPAWKRRVVGDAWVLVLPDPEDPTVHVWAESGSDHEAGQLAAEYARRIRLLAG